MTAVTKINSKTQVEQLKKDARLVFLGIQGAENYEVIKVGIATIYIEKPMSSGYRVLSQQLLLSDEWYLVE